MVLVIRSVYGAVLGATFLFTVLTVFTAATLSFPMSEPEVPVAPFPVGVDPNSKTIIEDPELDHFIANSGRAKWSLPSLVPSGRFARFIAKLSQSSWYQMAIPGGRLLVIFPGERKEEVAKNFGDILRWNADERQQFLTLVEEAVPELNDGQFYPERYLVAIDASPEDVAKMVVERFETEVVSRYDKNAEELLPMKEAIIIASLLEREAYDFDDMREISGVIWNRLFIDMNLQLDATLQYARGSQANTNKWWPVPTPADKYIESPYNTYKYGGLTPEPISNPSLEAVLAALNPAITDCLFYFHDSSSNFHCSADYKEHVAKLREIYGQGK
jgi:cell division protein YceG involved in septum cleavage